MKSERILKIGLALNAIGLLCDEETYKKIKPQLDIIETEVGNENIEQQNQEEEARKDAVYWCRKLIKTFWTDWNRQSKAKLSRVAYDELDEFILEQADETNGREFMEGVKLYTKGAKNE